jgi:LacI family transcriptional regulator
VGITIKDVAAVAGVSTATVSRVLSGKDHVSSDTAAHVREIVDRLGYHPDRVARALRQQRSHLIGVIVPDLVEPRGALVASLLEQFADADLTLAVACSHHHADREAAHVDRLLSQGIDGLLIVPADRARSAERILRAGDDVPIVQLEERVDAPFTDHVATDQAAGINHVVRHLVRERRTRIAFIGQGVATWTGEQRLRAFVDGAPRSGAEVVAVRVGGSTAEFGRQAARNLLSAGDPPDALLCDSDTIAFGALTTLRELDLSPEDVAITGFGGTDAAALVTPDLTTLAPPVVEIAAEAWRILLERLSGSADEPRSIVLSPRLIVRSSA